MSSPITVQCKFTSNTNSHNICSLKQKACQYFQFCSNNWKSFRLFESYSFLLSSQFSVTFQKHKFVMKLTTLALIYVLIIGICQGNSLRVDKERPNFIVGQFTRIDTNTSFCFGANIWGYWSQQLYLAKRLKHPFWRSLHYSD